MKVPFTAEVCARAIIAACASYGDDPLKITTFRTTARRAVAPAASAVRIATGQKLKTVCRAMGGSSFTVHHSEKAGAAHYLKAKTAALAAIGGAPAVLAPEPGPAKRPRQPDPETVSNLPDALLIPRPIAPPIVVEVVAVTPQPALPAPVAARGANADRNARIAELIAGGETNVAIATKLGLTIGVVAGQRNRLRRRLSAAKTPVARKAFKAAAPAPNDVGLVAGRAAPGPRFQRLAPSPADRVPEPARDRLAPTDQALIAEALAKGKVTQLRTAAAAGGFARGVAIPDHPAPLGYDPDKRKFSRGQGATRTGWFNA